MKANLKFARPVAAALGLLAFAGMPAFAADVVSEEPPAPMPIAELPIASWAGPYAGINLGYGFSGRVRDDGFSHKTDGFIGSGFAGYNWQQDDFVYGLEGELGYNGNKGSDGFTKSKSGFEGSLRARLGYSITPEILLYGTAGGAGQSLKVTDVGSGDSASKSMFGWTAGVGTDIKLTDNVFARVEYRYTDYGSKNFDTLDFGDRSVKSRDNRVTFGVGMKF